MLCKADFWKTSWEQIDPSRIASYIQSLDMTEDALISFLRQNKLKTVCDAGCGCGIYSLKLAANGFSVSGFDISEEAVEIARAVLRNRGYSAELKTADVLDTGYPDCRFDCVVSRDVLDHMKKAEAIKVICTPKVRHFWRCIFYVKERSNSKKVLARIQNSCYNGYARTPIELPRNSTKV